MGGATGKIETVNDLAGVRCSAPASAGAKGLIGTSKTFNAKILS
jgi:hypothetical protein